MANIFCLFLFKLLFYIFSLAILFIVLFVLLSHQKSPSTKQTAKNIHFRFIFKKNNWSIFVYYLGTNLELFYNLYIYLLEYHTSMENSIIDESIFLSIFVPKSIFN